jgi:hypothetical protein
LFFRGVWGAFRPSKQFPYWNPISSLIGILSVPLLTLSGISLDSRYVFSLRIYGVESCSIR